MEELTKKKSDKQIDEIIATLVRDHTDIWGRLRVASTEAFKVELGDDKLSYVERYYHGAPEQLLQCLRSVLTKFEWYQGDSADLVETAIQVIEGVQRNIPKFTPHHPSHFDTFTQEEVDLAAQSVKDNLPDDWAIWVAIQGGRLQPDADGAGGARARISIHVNSYLDPDWVPGTHQKSEEAFRRASVLFDHLRKAARRESSN